VGLASGSTGLHNCIHLHGILEESPQNGIEVFVQVHALDVPSIQAPRPDFVQVQRNKNGRVNMEMAPGSFPFRRP
jgi:hypothetical protein